jgi:hypothetical protein
MDVCCSNCFIFLWIRSLLLAFSFSPTSLLHDVIQGTVRAARSRTSNVPNPINWIFSSLARLEIVSNNASTAAMAFFIC